MKNKADNYRYYKIPFTKTKTYKIILAVAILLSVGAVATLLYFFLRAPVVYSEELTISFASEEDCPAGNIKDSALKSAMDFELNKTYYIVIDYAYTAPRDSNGRDNICADINLSPASNVSATLEETASANFSEKVVDDELNINIKYSVPEKEGDQKYIRIVVRVIPLKSDISYVRATFSLNDRETDLCSKVVTVNDNYVSGMTFTLNDDGQSFTLSGTTDNIGENVIIPSTHIGKKVTAIGESAFYQNEKVENIVVPDSITSIGGWAFFKCNNLISISLPDSITAIGDWTFYNCKSLINITLPSSLTYIGKGAFADCNKLAGVKFSNSLTTIGQQAFWGCDWLTEIHIPQSVMSIGQGAFSNCYNLSSITVDANNINYYSSENCLIFKRTNILICGCKNNIIPDGVVGIDNYAFEYCWGLKSIVIPKSVVFIGEFAFDWANGLTVIGVETGSPRALDYPCDLTTVYYGGTEEEWDLISIGSSNRGLLEANRYYYSETRPFGSNRYWHYVDGEIEIW